MQIQVGNASVTIWITGQTTGTSGNVTTPVFYKYGQQGANGKLNWQIEGVVPSDMVGNVTITDTPSGPTRTIDQNTWGIQLIDENGQSQYYNLQQAQSQLGATVTFDSNGGFTCTIPASKLVGKKFRILYTSTPTQTPSNGEVFVNKAAISGNKYSGGGASVNWNQNMSGNIVGFDSGKLTLQKQDGTTHVALAGAEFTLYKDGSVFATATTDAQGKVVFNNLTDIKRNKSSSWLSIK